MYVYLFKHVVNIAQYYQTFSSAVVFIDFEIAIYTGAKLVWFETKIKGYRFI